MMHFEQGQRILQMPNVFLYTFPGCAVEYDMQKYMSILVFPVQAAKKLEHLDGIECEHKSHKAVAEDDDLERSGVYTQLLADLLVSAHLAPPGIGDEDGALFLATDRNSNVMHMLVDCGASHSFTPTDELCVPGTDGPPTVTNTTLGNKRAVLQSQKSCLWNIVAPNTSQSVAIRMNVAKDVPCTILSVGQMCDEHNASFIFGPRGDWGMYLPSGAAFSIVRGAGSWNRLGFITAKVDSEAFALVIQPKTDFYGDWPVVAWVDDDEPADGTLMVSAQAPANAHMAPAKYSELELYKLLHCRKAHCSNSTLIATYKNKLTVGHDFDKIHIARYHRASMQARLLRLQLVLLRWSAARR
jgi:hypothetical protein